MQVLRRAAAVGIAGALTVPVMTFSAGATATAGAPSAAAESHGWCAQPSREVPSDAEIRANPCRPKDAGNFIERREYMVSGDEGATTSEPSEVGNTTWLTRHCVATLADASDTTKEYYTVASFGFKDDPNKTGDADLTSAQKDDFRVKIRQEIKGADGVIHKSGETGDTFHRRLACTKDAAGAYERTAVRFFNIYTDRTGDGIINCSDVVHYIKNTSPYSNPKVRYMVYMHYSLSGSTPKGASDAGEYCNYAVDETGHSSSPGLSNDANSKWGVAASETWETDGISGYSVALTNQELGHSHGLIASSGCSDSDKSKCAPGVEAANDGKGDITHTYDWPDFMNGGGGAYYYPKGYVAPSGYRAQQVCESSSKSIFGTANDLWSGGFIDCGRDTYWNPNPSTSNWLCTHYNYATDSRYFNNSYARSATCPAL